MKKTIPVTTLVEFVSGRMPPEEGLALLAQLEDDPEASAMLDKTIELVALASASGSGETRLGGTGRQALNEGSVRRGIRSIVRTLKYSPRRYLTVAAVGLLVCLAVLVLPHTSKENVVDLAIPSDEELHLLTRGAENGEVDLGAHLIAEGRTEDALRVLDWYIAAFPGSEVTSRAHFLSGLAHLKRGKRTILGWYVGIDRSEVLAAEAQFVSAMMLSRSPDLSSEAQWYLARAQVLMDPGGMGLESLALVRQEGGVHGRAAERLLEALKASR